MTKARLAGAACLLFIAITASRIYCTRAHISPLQKYYTDLVHHYDPSKLPKLEDVVKVTKQISEARPEEITKALPAIFAALAHQDFTVSGYAASALYSIALRPDSAELLRGHVDAIGHELASPIPETRASAIVILGTLKPVPPPEVVPILLAFLKRTGADAQAQGGGVIFELVRIAPENPEAIAAVREFLSRPLDSTTRIGTLNALGNPHVKDVGLVAMVVTSLDDPDEGVRFTAIQTLGRMGKNAVLQGQAALQRLAAIRSSQPTCRLPRKKH